MHTSQEFFNFSTKRHSMNLKWRRTEGSIVRQDDWSLFDDSGDRIAQLFNTGEDDLIGSWSWRVWLDHKMQEGSARTGTEARKTCERLLAEYQQAQIAQQ
jgi:hypothetical protein